MQTHKKISATTELITTNLIVPTSKKDSIDKEAEDLEEISEELKEETELQDIAHHEILKALCQIATKNSKESVDLVPTLIGECAEHNLYEKCDETIGTIQKANPEGTINVLAKSLKGKKDKEYRNVRLEYITKNPICEVKGCKSTNVEIHHKMGRVGDLYTNPEYFMSVCRSHHRWIEEHPEKAKEIGYSLNRL